MCALNLISEAQSHQDDRLVDVAPALNTLIHPWSSVFTLIYRNGEHLSSTVPLSL